MGVYVKWLNMPKNCKDCPLSMKLPDNDELKNWGHCTVTGLEADLSDTDGIGDGCPLIPVPAHGRLGDLDELLHRAFECVDEETMLSFDMLVDGCITLIPAEED
jgi:hypothetical protein